MKFYARTESVPNGHPVGVRSGFTETYLQTENLEEQKGARVTHVLLAFADIF
jgi:hypothetical protein